MIEGRQLQKKSLDIFWRIREEIGVGGKRKDEWKEGKEEGRKVETRRTLHSLRIRCRSYIISGSVEHTPHWLRKLPWLTAEETSLASNGMQTFSHSQATPLLAQLGRHNNSARRVTDESELPAIWVRNGGRVTVSNYSEEGLEGWKKEISHVSPGSWEEADVREGTSRAVTKRVYCPSYPYCITPCVQNLS